MCTQYKQFSPLSFCSRLWNKIRLVPFCMMFFFFLSKVVLKGEEQHFRGSFLRDARASLRRRIMSSGRRHRIPDSFELPSTAAQPDRDIGKLQDIGKLTLEVCGTPILKHTSE